MKTTTTADDRIPGFQFSTRNPPKVGDVVRLGGSEVATVKSYSDGLLRFTDRGFNWALWPTPSSSRCTLETPAAAPATPVEPSAPMTRAVLGMLRQKGDVTAIEAIGVLRCRSLSKRISELKDLGHKITRDLFEDHTGQRYARYSLVS